MTLVSVLGAMALRPPVHAGIIGSDAATGAAFGGRRG
jgi:hypothetical protein